MKDRDVKALVDEAKRIINKQTTKRDILEQLAEESAELGHAALKLIRASGDTNNITPIKEETALDNLIEEVLDVALLMDLMFDIDNVAGATANNPKWWRWANRLEERDGRKK